MNFSDVLTLLGFAIFAIALPTFAAGLIHYLAKYSINRLNKLK